MSLSGTTAAAAAPAAIPAECGQIQGSRQRKTSRARRQQRATYSRSPCRSWLGFLEEWNVWKGSLHSNENTKQFRINILMIARVIRAQLVHWEKDLWVSNVKAFVLLPFQRQTARFPYIATHMISLCTSVCVCVRELDLWLPYDMIMWFDNLHLINFLQLFIMSTFGPDDDSRRRRRVWQTVRDRQQCRGSARRRGKALAFQTLSNSNCFNYRIQFIVTLWDYEACLAGL